MTAPARAPKGGGRKKKGAGAPPGRAAGAAKPVKRASPGADNASGTRSGGFELTELRTLIDLVQSTGIGELEVTTGGRTIRIAAAAGTVPVATVTATGAAAGAAAPATAPAGAPAAAAPGNQTAITSPMVGTFYRAPAPDADPYVEVGDTVTVGQTVCIVEAMKLMNEIESEVKGRVVKILVENSQPVEYGQKLFLVET
jgi:acetyl-CoA carboxylase biotin carboxyl carrier protein